MTNLRKIVSIIMVVFLVSAVTTIAFATNDGIQIIGNTNIDDGNVLNITDTTTGTQNTANTINVINTINTTNTSTYSNTTNLPQTGAGDYAMILIIAIFAISAVYAYKKINDYKNI